MSDETHVSAEALRKMVETDETPATERLRGLFADRERRYAEMEKTVTERAERAEALIKSALDYMFANPVTKPAYDDCECGCTEDYVSVSTMRRILSGG